MNKSVDFVKQVFRGKSIYRILFNWQVFRYCQNLSGRCVDLGAGRNPSYTTYWSFQKDATLVRGDIGVDKKTDLVIDLNEPLPFSDDSVDNMFLFNVIYVIKKPEELVAEIHRSLKRGGILFMASPYITNEMKEPDDFRRFTSQGIEDLLIQSGFSDFQIIPFGGRATAAMHLLHPYFIFNVVRLIAFLKALALDRILPAEVKRRHPCPLGYFVIVRK